MALVQHGWKFLPAAEGVPLLQSGKADILWCWASHRSDDTGMLLLCRTTMRKTSGTSFRRRSSSTSSATLSATGVTRRSLPWASSGRRWRAPSCARPLACRCARQALSPDGSPHSAFQRVYVGAAVHVASGPWWCGAVCSGMLCHARCIVLMTMWTYHLISPRQLEQMSSFLPSYTSCMWWAGPIKHVSLPASPP